MSNPTLDFSGNPPTLVQNIQDLISGVVSQYVVTPLGGQNSSGISGFVMDVVADEEVTDSSEITDHYGEDNFSIQDHIAQKPTKFVVKGYVAEIVNVLPQTLVNIYSQISGLPIINSLLPNFTTQATQVYSALANSASQVGNFINQIQNAFALFGLSNTTATKQQLAYSFLKQMKGQNQLVTVETPYTIFNNMAIEEFRALQKEDNKYVSEFTITFKEIRTVSTSIVQTPLNNPNGSGDLSNLSPTQVTSAGNNLLNNTVPSVYQNVAGRDAQYIQMDDPVLLGSTNGNPNDAYGNVLNSTSYFSKLAP